MAKWRAKTSGSAGWGGGRSGVVIVSGAPPNWPARSSSSGSVGESVEVVILVLLADAFSAQDDPDTTAVEARAPEPDPSVLYDDPAQEVERVVAKPRLLPLEIDSAWVGAGGAAVGMGVQPSGQIAARQFHRDQ